jgi:hypothetical protein
MTSLVKPVMMAGVCAIALVGSWKSLRKPEVENRGSVNAMPIAVLDNGSPTNGKIEKNARILSRVHDYYAALEAKDYAKAWSFLGVRLHEKYKWKKDEYVAKQSAYYFNLKVIGWPTVNDLVWDSAGTGDDVREVAVVRTVLRLRTAQSNDESPLVETTWWVKEGKGNEGEWNVFDQRWDVAHHSSGARD